MRNLRKLTAVVIAIALVLTSMATAFAAATPANGAKAATLKDLKLYAGTDDTNPAAGLENALTTQDSLIWLATLFGYKAEADKMTDAEATKALAKFADAAKVADYAKKVVAYSADNGIIAGAKAKDGKLFVKPTATVTAARFATFIVNGLGYDLEGSYTEAVAQLAEINGNKIDAAAAGDLTRDAAVGMMYGTLTAKTAAGKAVIENIVAATPALQAVAEKAGLIVSSTLDVASVTSTNLRELVITYNKAVPNVDAAKKASNYKIGSNNPEAATLSDDNKTVTIRTTSANFMGNYGTVDLTIDKAVGFAANKEIKGIAIKDTTVPYAVSVSTSGPKNIKVTLSEPLNTHNPVLSGSDISNSIKIDGGLIAVDTTNTTTSGVELNIKTFSDLSEGSHKIEFIATGSKLLDNAGYLLQGATLTFDYVKDTSALSLSVVESNETSVTVKFNKAIKTGSFKGNHNVEITHTYNTATNKVFGDTDVTTTDDQKFVISFGSNKPFPPGSTTVFIGYGSGSDKIEDNYGNKLAATSFALTTTADLTKPTATAEFVDAKTVKVTFSEDVLGGTNGSNSAENEANYVLKSGSDVIGKTAAFDTDSKKVVKLTTAQDALNGTTYTLTVKNVKDTSVAGNQIDEVTLTFTGTDKVAPSVKTADSKLVAANKYKVVYSEAMDVATITNKSLYKINGNALGDDDKVEAVDNGKAALITFKNNITGTNNVITIGWVKDAAGNYSATFVTPTVAFDTTVAKVALAEYQITGKNAIKLKFKDTLKDMVTADFEYTTNGSVYVTPDSLSVSAADGETYITLVTKDIPNTTGGGVEVRTVGTTKAKNSFDSTLSFNTTLDVDGTAGKDITIGDKCAPSKSTVTFTTKAGQKSGTQVATVVVTYSEALYASSIQDADFTVAGYEVDSVNVAGSVVTITLKNVDYGSYRSGDDVKVKQVGEIQDSAKNVLAAQDEWSVK